MVHVPLIMGGPVPVLSTDRGGHYPIPVDEMIQSCDGTMKFTRNQWMMFFE